MVAFSGADDGCVPKKRWKLVVFDPAGHPQERTVPVNEREYYLVGSNADLVHIYNSDPSVGGQHAALQHRRVDATKKDDPPGVTRTTVKPYLIDLNSDSGSFVNGTRIPSSRFYQLHSKDLITFGSSPIQYVLVRPPKSR